jgi:hypothetical protein
MSTDKSEIYQFNVAEGDIVQMPNGKLGVVVHVGFPGTAMWHVKEVRVRPFGTGLLAHCWNYITEHYRFYDNKINQLQLLRPAATHIGILD